jgi:hypothetical protein
MKSNSLLLTAIAAAALAAPQQFQLNLDSLSAKAANSVDLNLSGATLKFAANFLDSHDPDETAVKKLIVGLDGIYVKHFEFKTDNAWSQADLDNIRNQLRAPAWQRVIGVKDADSNENSDIYLHVEGGKTTGVAILVSEPREITVINIAGAIDLDQLAELGGHFDIPKVSPPPKDKKPK